MRIRVLKGFRDYLPGQVFEDWPGGMCQILIGQGLIEEVRSDSAPAEPEPKAATVEVADEEPAPLERADASPKRRKKP